MDNFNRSHNFEPFVKVPDSEISKLIPILEQRLPQSVFIHNAAKMYPRFTDTMSFYTLNGTIDTNAFIVSVVLAEDYGLDYSISAIESSLTTEEALRVLTSPLFRWDDPHLFTPSPKWLSRLVYEVSVNLHSNIVEFHPSKIFWMPINQALDLQINPQIDPDDKTTPKIQRLDPTSGVEFIMSTWKFAKEGTSSVISRLIERNESGGVYIDKVPVCGCVVHPFGMVSALNTKKEHRNKGYANLCLKFVYKELAKTGIIPASAVDYKNEASIKFHEKLGCEKSCFVADYIIFSNPGF